MAGVVVASDGVYVGAVFPDQALGIIAAGGQDAGDTVVTIVWG